MNTIGKRIEDEPEEQPAGASDKAVLGSLGSEPADSVLIDAPALPRHMEKALADAPLELPKGALVAMRKSGGLRFTSRTVVIHRDGQVTQPGRAAARAAKAPARLNNRQLSELKRAVASSMLTGAAAKSAGRQNPDAYAYEIVARIDRRVMTAEVFDGSIPGGLAGLIRQLSRYLPSER